jgi:geranylgeranyl diphosphate synthase type I
VRSDDSVTARPGEVDVPLGFSRETVQQRLASFLTAKAEQFAAISPDLSEALAAATDLLAGGKRLRPAFLYWGWRAAGGAGDPDTDEPRVLTAAAALELLQASALVHDDVMDGSDLRRGLPAAHRRFAALHRSAGWVGSPEAFGTGAAILLGDLCLSWSDELLRACGLPAHRLLPAMRLFDDMRTEVIAGQYLDLVEQATGGASVERALLVVRFKSAKYTVERPLHVGAVLAGGGPELVRRLSAYGTPLGEAFQLRDDVLGVFGDPSVTGKPAGDDMREGKRTVLVAEAMASATPSQAAVFRRFLGDPRLTASGLAALREVVVSTGALDRVERRIEDLTDQSLCALDAADLVDPEARAALRELVDATTRRVV